LQYFFDSSRVQCFPIESILCSHESTERFSTLRECESRIPQDFSACAANSPPVKKQDGESYCYFDWSPEYIDSIKCPTGSFCQKGFASVGMCCDKKINDWKAKCPRGRKAIRDPIYDFDRLFIGKKCSHNFCPSDTICHEGKYLAWC
ncbi:hypothetical protein PMAYCL1PPCAC_21538, partial [Pristionchus mayeri]